MFSKLDFVTLLQNVKERYERIQYSAARLVTGTLQTTSKFKLFEELG